MFFNIIYATLISIITIFIVHNIFTYIKSTLTAPKIKDLINKPKYEYDKINDLIHSDNIVLNNSSSSNKEDNKIIKNNSQEDTFIDCQEIKSELKDFFNELNNNTSNNVVSDYNSYNDNNLNSNF